MYKFTFVTGDPRSGTSMMMQTLHLLGLPIWANSEESFHKSETDQKHGEMMNPGGFFETEYVTIGLDCDRSEGVGALHMKTLLDQHNNSVIKVISYGLVRTNKDYIDKAILCLRHPADVASSQTQLTTGVEVANRHNEWEPVLLPFQANKYIMGMGSLALYMYTNPELWDRIHIVHYEDMHEDADKTISELISFLDIDVDDRIKDSAVKNVEPSLRRRRNTDYPDEDIWQLSLRIYEAIQSMSVSDELVLEINYAQRQLRLENVSWLDESVWTNCRPSFYRKIQRHDVLRMELEDLKDGKDRLGRLCTACPYYNRDGESYLIERPEDLGPLERSMVRCREKGQDITLEHCQGHWNTFRITLNGE